MIVLHLDIKSNGSFPGVAHSMQKTHDFDVARVVLMHNHTRNTRIHLAEKNMDTISHAQGNMSALFYGHGNMSRNGNLYKSITSEPAHGIVRIRPVMKCENRSVTSFAEQCTALVANIIRRSDPT